MEAIIHFYKVDDLKNVKKFYEDILGFTLYKDQTKCLIYDCDGLGYLGFCTHHPKKQNDSTCITFVYKTKDEVLNMYTYLVDKGLSIKPPVLNEVFNIYHFFVKDFEGHTLEFQTFN